MDKKDNLPFNFILNIFIVIVVVLIGIASRTTIRSMGFDGKDAVFIYIVIVAGLFASYFLLKQLFSTLDLKGYFTSRYFRIWLASAISWALLVAGYTVLFEPFGHRIYNSEYILLLKILIAPIAAFFLILWIFRFLLKS